MTDKERKAKVVSLKETAMKTSAGIPEHLDVAIKLIERAQAFFAKGIEAKSKAAACASGKSKLVASKEADDGSTLEHYEDGCRVKKTAQSTIYQMPTPVVRGVGWDGAGGDGTGVDCVLVQPKGAPMTMQITRTDPVGAEPGATPGSVMEQMQFSDDPEDAVWLSRTDGQVQLLGSQQVVGCSMPSGAKLQAKMGEDISQNHVIQLPEGVKVGRSEGREIVIFPDGVKCHIHADSFGCVFEDGALCELKHDGTFLVKEDLDCSLKRVMGDLSDGGSKGDFQLWTQKQAHTREQLRSQEQRAVNPLDFDNEAPELVAQLKAKQEALKLLKVETEKKVADARACYVKTGPVLLKAKLAIDKAEVCRESALKLVEGNMVATQTQQGRGADGEEVVMHSFEDGSRLQRTPAQGMVQVVLGGDAGIYQTKEEAAAGAGAQKELVVLGQEQVTWSGSAGGGGPAGAAGAAGAGGAAGASAGAVVWATPDGNRVIAADTGATIITASNCSGCQFQVQADPTDAQLLQVAVTTGAADETVQLLAAASGGAKPLTKTQEGYGLVNRAGSKMQLDGKGNFTVESVGEDSVRLCLNGDVLITRKDRSQWKFSGTELVSLTRPKDCPKEEAANTVGEGGEGEGEGEQEQPMVDMPQDTAQGTVQTSKRSEKAGGKKLGGKKGVAGMSSPRSKLAQAKELDATLNSGNSSAKSLASRSLASKSLASKSLASLSVDVGDVVEQEVGPAAAWRRHSSTACAMLDTVSKAEVQEVKSYASPPKMIGRILEATCICLGISRGKNAYATAKKMLANTNAFIPRLKSFDPLSINAKMMADLKPFIDDPSLDADNMAKASKAATGLSLWVHAVYAFGMQSGVQV
jgi:hypothetical protein